MRSKLSRNQGSGGYSYHHTNNRKTKADLIFEWRKEPLCTREKIGRTGHMEIYKPNGKQTTARRHEGRSQTDVPAQAVRASSRRARVVEYD
jgi:hypothetical protein